MGFNDRPGFKAYKVNDVDWIWIPDPPPASVAEDNVFIFVSTSGNDANPGTAALPVLTPDRAFVLIPAGWKKQCKIFLAPGVYFSNLTSQIKIGSPLGPSATPLAIIGGFTDELGTIAANAPVVGPAFTVPTALALVVDAYRGGWIRALSGANIGQRRMITANDATTFSLNAAYDFGIAPGDTFTVERPSVTINFNSFLPWFDGLIGMKGIKWVPTNPDGFWEGYSGMFYVPEACEFDGGGFFFSYLILNYGLMSPGSKYRPWIADGIDNPFSPLRWAAGCYFHDCAVTLGGGQMVVEPFLVVDNFFMNVSETGMFTDSGNINGRNTSILVDELGIMNVGPSAFTNSARSNIDTDLIGDPNLGIVMFNENASNFQFDAIDISNSSGHGILIMNGANPALADVGGSGNAGYGIRVMDGAQVQIDGSLFISGTTTITGALGDTKLEVDIKSYAQLHVPDGNGVLGFTDAYLNRIKVGPL